MTIGEKIRKRRLELNMTMDELGAVIGVQRSAINKYEKGYVDLKASTIISLARALNISIPYLFDDSCEAVSPEDLRLLSSFHSADPSVQSSILRLLCIPDSVR